ncbi:MAG: hypothetical protein HY301_17065 [Verrucomicrobia bacterium]|nr:hypothetical protein [Verrucomicrobiota bacterium]
MGWQDYVAISVVLLTVGLFVWARARRPRFSFQRDTHCGCSAGAGDAPKSSIVFHARKGERSRIVMKMK